MGNIINSQTAVQQIKYNMEVLQDKSSLNKVVCVPPNSVCPE